MTSSCILTLFTVPSLSILNIFKFGGLTVLMLFPQFYFNNNHYNYNFNNNYYNYYNYVPACSKWQQCYNIVISFIRMQYISWHWCKAILTCIAVSESWFVHSLAQFAVYILHQAPSPAMLHYPTLLSQSDWHSAPSELAWLHYIQHSNHKTCHEKNTFLHSHTEHKSWRTTWGEATFCTLQEIIKRFTCWNKKNNISRLTGLILLSSSCAG